MREQKEIEGALLKIRDFMLARWAATSRIEAKVEDKERPGRGAASTGSPTPIGAKRKGRPSSNSEAKPPSKRIVNDEDL